MCENLLTEACAFEVQLAYRRNIRKTLLTKTITDLQILSISVFILVSAQCHSGTFWDEHRKLQSLGSHGTVTVKPNNIFGIDK